MAKLYFRYGAMGSSKTANALMVRFNYIEKGRSVLMLKSGSDTRDGKDIISSRIGLSVECINAEKYLDNIDKMYGKSAEDFSIGYDVIIVDEVQFLSEGYIEILAYIVDRSQIPVICYGLKTDFTGHLFEGSMRLLELADVIEEIPTICWCGKKAHFNARVINGSIVKNGKQIMLGGNESYVSLCRKHYMNEQLE